MSRYSISHVWNEDPDYELFAAQMLDLLLNLEERGILEDIIGDLGSSDSTPNEEAA